MNITIDGTTYTVTTRRELLELIEDFRVAMTLRLELEEAGALSLELDEATEPAIEEVKRTA
jgi:hypothetical protein